MYGARHSNDSELCWCLAPELHEASSDKYQDIFNNTQTPFFFIGTDSSLPFTESNYSYREKNWKDLKGTSYAVGLGAGELTGYGLYNDVENKKNLLDLYSRIFRTVEEYKALL